MRHLYVWQHKNFKLSSFRVCDKNGENMDIDYRCKKKNECEDKYVMIKRKEWIQKQNINKE